MIPSREPLLQPSERKSARFIDRKGTDERSNGLLLVVRLLLLGTFNISKTGYLKSDAYKDDWFHSFASLSTRTVILSILFAVWFSYLGLCCSIWSRFFSGLFCSTSSETRVLWIFTAF